MLTCRPQDIIYWQLPKPLTDLVEDENSDVSNNKDQVESQDESDDEDKAV